MTIKQLCMDRRTNALRQFSVPEDFSVPVTCPITRKRLKHPAISLNCTHHERIELKAWLNYVLEHQRWICPYCECKSELPDIYVDSKMQHCLEDAQGDLLAENIQCDGSGDYIITRKLTKQRSSVLASALGDTNRRGVTVLLKGVDNAFHDFMLTSSDDSVGPDTYTEAQGFSPKTVYLLELGMPFIQRFDITSNKWRLLNGFRNPGNSVVNMVSVYSDQAIFFLGGQDSNRKALSAVYVLKEKDVMRIADMPTARYSFCALITKNRLYVCGGLNDSGLLTQCERMEMTTGRWVEVMPMPKARANAGACVVGMEFFFVFGGVTNKDFYSRDIERFHIVSSVWESLYVRMPVGISDPLVYNVSDLSIVFIMGGYGEAGKLRSVLSFSYRTGIWKDDHPRLKVPVVEHAFFPVMFDYEHKVMHFFDGRGGSNSPIKHLYYSIETLFDVVNEEEESGSDESDEENS